MARSIRPAGNSATTAILRRGIAVARPASSRPPGARVTTEIPARPPTSAMRPEPARGAAHFAGTAPWIAPAGSSATTEIRQAAIAAARLAGSILSGRLATTETFARGSTSATVLAAARGADPFAETGLWRLPAGSSATTGTPQTVTAVPRLASWTPRVPPATTATCARQRTRVTLAVPASGAVRAAGTAASSRAAGSSATTGTRWAAIAVARAAGSS